MFAAILLFLLPDPAAELTRFPPRLAVREAKAANLAYWHHIVNRQAVALHWRERSYCEAVKCELWECWYPWDALDQALYVKCPNEQLVRLRRLRELLGEDAYQRGRLPPAVPLWRFERIE